MKFTEHTKVKLDDTCTVLWRGNEIKVSSLPTQEINNETYYLLDEGNNVKIIEGETYQDGDKLYLKKDCKNIIIKEDYDHWRAMAKTFVFNGDTKHDYRRCNNYHIRCW